MSELTEPFCYHCFHTVACTIRLYSPKGILGLEPRRNVCSISKGHDKFWCGWPDSDRHIFKDTRLSTLRVYQITPQPQNARRGSRTHKIWILSPAHIPDLLCGRDLKNSTRVIKASFDRLIVCCHFQLGYSPS